jgi:adenosine deaminase
VSLCGLEGEYLAVATAFDLNATDLNATDLNATDLAQLAKNAVNASFLNAASKSTLLAEIGSVTRDSLPEPGGE